MYSNTLPCNEILCKKVDLKGGQFNNNYKGGLYRINSWPTTKTKCYCDQYKRAAAAGKGRGRAGCPST